jgi:polyhydroxyalkanoate synthesis regulator phasin
MDERKPEPGPNERDKRALHDILRDTWMSALGVFSSAEAELNRATHRLAEVVGRPKEEAQHLAQELSGRMRKNRAALERKVEESVRSVAERLRGALSGQVAELRARVERLQARIEEHARNRGPRPPG